jgi:hypothetical protein
LPSSSDFVFFFPTSSFSTPLTIGSGPPSTVACYEERDDGKKVVSEFLGLRWSTRTIVDDEVCAVVSEQPFQNLHADASEAVAVGNHDL